MMDQHNLRQLRGLKDLVQETVDDAVGAIADVHREMARRPYALMSHLPLIGRPAREIERVQHDIIDGIYGSIRAVNAVVGKAASYTLDRLEEEAVRPE